MALCLTQLQVFGWNSGKLMGVAQHWGVGLACSVPASLQRQTLKGSWSTSRKAKKPIYCVARCWTKFSRYTSSHTADYHFESKDNTNVRIVLHRFAWFHMVKLTEHKAVCTEHVFIQALEQGAKILTILTKNLFKFWWWMVRTYMFLQSTKNKTNTPINLPRKDLLSTMAGLEPAIPRSEVWCLIH